MTRVPALAVLFCLLTVWPSGVVRAQSFGPPTPGICFLSRSRVLDQTHAGAAANQRIAQFERGIAAELSGERAAIAADANVLQIQRPVISEAIYQQRAGALALREQSFQTLENTRNNQILRTRGIVTGKLIGEMAPILASLLSEHGCSAVLEAAGAYAVNPRMDLTAQIIQIMDIRLPPFNFNLEPPAQ